MPVRDGARRERLSGLLCERARGGSVDLKRGRRVRPRVCS